MSEMRELFNDFKVLQKQKMENKNQNSDIIAS